MLSAPSGRLELFLLGIFKWVVIVAMLVFIAATAWLCGYGLLQLFHSPAVPEPAKLAAKPGFSSADFLQAINPKQSDKTTGGSQGATPSTLVEDTSESAFRVQAERLWLHVQKYQSDCSVGAPLGKIDFIESLRITPLKTILESRGNEFAISEDAFVKDILGNPEVVKLCKSGRLGIFFSVLEFHRSNWDRQVQDGKLFEAGEQERLKAFEQAEANLAASRKATSSQAFLGGAMAFGLFMCVALVLIFARLESNLRGVNTIVRAPNEAAPVR